VLSGVEQALVLHVPLDVDRSALQCPRAEAAVNALADADDSSSMSKTTEAIHSSR
jgi:hypothetical protein